MRRGLSLASDDPFQNYTLFAIQSAESGRGINLAARFPRTNQLKLDIHHWFRAQINVAALFFDNLRSFYLVRLRISAG